MRQCGSQEFFRKKGRSSTTSSINGNRISSSGDHLVSSIPTPPTRRLRRSSSHSSFFSNELEPFEKFTLRKPIPEKQDPLADKVSIYRYFVVSVET
jgi:hypothetical protein